MPVSFDLGTHIEASMPVMFDYALSAQCIKLRIELGVGFKEIKTALKVILVITSDSCCK